jgi:tryptophan synthase alpha chain
MIEIGLPFSDPLADGPHSSSTMALHNGMTSQLLFDQLSTIRESVKIPYYHGIFQLCCNTVLKPFVKM